MKVDTNAKNNTSERSNAGGAPVEAGTHGRTCPLNGSRGSSGLRRATAEHNATGENGCLASIVVRDLGLALIDEDARLAGTFPAGQLGRCLSRRGRDGRARGHGGRVRRVDG